MGLFYPLNHRPRPHSLQIPDPYPHLKLHRPLLHITLYISQNTKADLPSHEVRRCYHKVRFPYPIQPLPSTHQSDAGPVEIDVMGGLAVGVVPASGGVLFFELGALVVNGCVY